MAAAEEPFRCDVSHERGTAYLRLVGELDLDTTPLLQAEIVAARETGSGSLVVDLSELSFMDSTGLHCILECDAESRRNGFTFVLVQGPPAVHRVFELTNTQTQLPFAQR